MIKKLDEVLGWLRLALSHTLMAVALCYCSVLLLLFGLPLAVLVLLGRGFYPGRLPWQVSSGEDSKR